MEEDKRLYKEFLDGNQASFEKIVDMYIQRITYFIFGFVKEIDIAEDLAQDVFVYLLVNRQNYNFDYSLKTYLYMIAKCRAINYLKKVKTRNETPFEEYQRNEELEEIEEKIFDNMRDKNLHNAIIQLNQKQSRILYLAKIECLKVKEIAQILNISESDVKISIHRGIRKLKKIIGEEDDLYV